MRQHYSGSVLGTVLLVAGLLSVPATVASAVPDESSAYPEKQADLEMVIEQLQAENPGLSKDEAMELAGLASSEVSREILAPGVGAGENREGIILHSPTNLGSGELTPEEQALSEKVGARANELAGQGLSKEKVDSVLRKEFEQEFKQFEGIAPGERDDAQLRELYERSTPGLVEHAGGLEQRGGGAEVERYREMTEHGAAQEQTSRELPSVERGERAPVSEREAPQSREVEQHREAPETTRETVQREGSGSGPAPAERPEQYREYTPPQG